MGMPQIEGLFEVALKIFIRRGEEMLVLIANNTRSGDFPGGRLAPSDSLFNLEGSLRREIEEELGKNVSLRISKEPLFYFPYTSKGGRQEVLGMALAGEFLGGDINLSNEHIEFLWISPGQALHLFEGDFQRGLQRYIDLGSPRLSGDFYEIHSL